MFIKSSFFVLKFLNIKDSETGEVVKEQCVHKKKVNAAHDFQDLGLRHCDQLQLIKASQDFMLEFQCELFTDITHCPTCNKKLRKQGSITSDVRRAWRKTRR